MHGWSMHPRQVIEIRGPLPRALFARFLRVEERDVAAWEESRRGPEGPALALLELLWRRPSALLVLRDLNLAAMSVSDGDALAEHVEALEVATARGARVRADGRLHRPR
jgi:hypothetical protein